MEIIKSDYVVIWNYFASETTLERTSKTTITTLYLVFMINVYNSKQTQLVTTDPLVWFFLLYAVYVRRHSNVSVLTTRTATFSLIQSLGRQHIFIYPSHIVFFSLWAIHLYVPSSISNASEVLAIFINSTEKSLIFGECFCESIKIMFHFSSVFANLKVCSMQILFMSNKITYGNFLAAILILYSLMLYYNSWKLLKPSQEQNEVFQKYTDLYQKRR